MYITIETYPDMMINGEENLNYDNEIRVFSVPYPWFKDYVAQELEQTIDEFYDTYTYDWSIQMYDTAVAEDMIIKESIEPRDW